MTARDEHAFLIRRADTADVPLLAQLGATTFVEAFGENYPREDLEAFLASAYSEDAVANLVGDSGIGAWLGFADAGVPVGFAVAGRCKLPVADPEPGAGEIRQLYLRTAWQNRGLGTLLLTAALDWLAACGRRPVYVGVWSKNPGAQRLYARYGFLKVDEYDFPVGRILDREFILKRS